MLVKRLLLVKMKKCYSISLVSVVLLTIIYLLSRKEEIPVLIEKEINSLLPNDKVHIFYDARFQNIATDGQYSHWNYEEINVDERIASAYFPELGLYSSNNPKIIDIHMKKIRDAGIGVIVVLWWPENFKESPPMPLLLKYAQKYGLKVTIQIQDYKYRNIQSLRKNLFCFFQKYRHHPALYKTTTRNIYKPLPLIYVYDSYKIPPPYWSKLLGYGTNESIRGTDLDAIYLGLLTEETQQYLILNGDFDGFYTFFALYNFTYGSTWHNWPYIQDFANKRDIIFIPTVSPGYNDRSKSPFSYESDYYANRKSGAYYMNAWMRAVICRSRFISINSFNGWTEGTQIESAQPKTTNYKDVKFQYNSYEPESPNFYLKITKSWIMEFTKRSIMRSFN